MSSALNRDEFIAGYLIEADEHVRSATANLLAVEAALAAGTSQHRLIRELFRALHTLKGLSAMVGIDPIVDLSHEMEAILRDADRSTGKLSAPAADLLLKGVRAIEQRVSAVAKKKPVAAAPRKLLDALADLHSEAQAAPAARGPELTLDAELAAKLAPVERDQLVQSIMAGRRVLRIDFLPSAERSARGVSITSVREQVATLGEIIKVIPRSLPKADGTPSGLAFVLLVLTDAADEQLAAATHAEPSTFLRIDVVRNMDSLLPLPNEFDGADDEHADVEQVSRDYIRVDISRLDDALEKLSALAVTRFRLTHAMTALREQGIDVREINSILVDNYRQLRDLRGAILRARMVSVAELLERVPLIVRGMNRSTGKQVRLQIDAGKTELDKAVAEQVFPAIVHLVRNAVDHAIEPPAERERLGKPSEGTITVTCFEHSDTQLEINVSDDGAGIDAEAVARRAGAETPADTHALLALITRAGLSTMQEATNNSGRGMGMDIVRRIAVEMLGGELSLRTERAVGTTFTMRLPLSISILDSFSFMCGAQAFAVPVSVIDEVIELEAGNVVETPAPLLARAGVRIVQRRGEAIPLFRLASLLNLTASPNALGKAFIIRPHGQAFAFAIDRVLGQQEIVVRPVDDPLVKVAGVAGTTDLGDGKPTLVLDLVKLSALATARTREVAA